MREILKKLSEAFGPSGYEDAVREAIENYIGADLPENCSVEKDRVGNIYFHGENKGKPRLMINAHMDEVGFMVTGITENGFLKFGCVGGMNPLVLGAKRVVSENGIKGVTVTKPIHLLSPEERKELPSVDSMCIDIGAESKEDAKKYVHVGDYFVFDSGYVEYGDGFIKCKALDDRHGCAIMCKLIDDIKAGASTEYDLWFAFTCREEVSYSSARCAAEYVKPDLALVIESKAVQDIYGVPEEKKVCILGDGAIISFMDNSTIYDRSMVEHLISLAEKNGIKYQKNKYISGGNDSAAIQKSIWGVKVGLISAASRYIHSQANVVKYEDIDAMYKIAYSLITSEILDIKE